jgi:hypothetical protein
VVGLRCDVAFRYVTLNSRTALGKVKSRQRRRGYECRQIMVAFAAGAVAQDIATGCRDRLTGVRAAREDFVEVRDCARLIRQAQHRGEPTGMELSPRATVRKISEVAWVEAYRIVTSEYGAVLAIADALLSSSRALTSKDCRRIIDAANKVEPPAIAHLAESFWPSWFMRGWWVPAPRTA